MIQIYSRHCVKSVRIRSYSGPHFPAFGLNTERYEVSHRIQLKFGKMVTRKTPNTDTFHAFRSKDLQTQKMWSCVLKAIWTILNIVNMLLNLKTNKDEAATNITKAMSPLTQTCTDSIVYLGHVNCTIEQKRRDHIAGC